MIKTGLEYLRDNIEETNIPEEHFEIEIGEIMDWYADYYHREKMKQCARLTHPAIEERNRILGIIEEMATRKEIHEKSGHPKFYVNALQELTQKIKGE